MNSAFSKAKTLRLGSHFSKGEEQNSWRQIGQCGGSSSGRHAGLNTNRCGSETHADTLSDVEAEALMEALANVVAGKESETMGEILSDMEAYAQVSTLLDTEEEVSV